MGYSQNHNKIKIYLFPGQGSDNRLFSNLELDRQFEMIPIQYEVPDKRATIKEYAQVLVQKIDTTDKYILLGVSLGGMICTELADVLNPDKILIISSAKSRKELPGRYKFQKYIPLNKIIPKKIIKFGALVLQPIVEPDRNQEKELFKQMLSSKDPVYLKRSINMIVNWNRTSYSNKIIHIQGTNDHTIPIRNVIADYKIKKGSHMMILTQGKELSNLINKILLN